MFSTPALPTATITETQDFTTTPRTAKGRNSMILAGIYRPEVNLAVVERELTVEVATYAEFVVSLPERVHISRVISVDLVKSVLRNCLPDHLHREAFLQDMETLATAMGLLFDLEQVGLRLQCEQKPGCPRFHYDRIVCRLLTTYYGRGTQWLDEDNLNRESLGHQAGPDGLNMCLNQSRIHELKCGHVALLKGDRWEGNEDRAIVHRSPPLTAGERRLLLTLDMA